MFNGTRGRSLSRNVPKGLTLESGRKAVNKKLSDSTGRSCEQEWDPMEAKRDYARKFHPAVISLVRTTRLLQEQTRIREWQTKTARRALHND